MRARHLATAVGILLVPLGACGGRLLDDPRDATAEDANDGAIEGPYTGEWCDTDSGPTDGPGPGVIFCLKNSYTDADQYCHRAYSATVKWNCCGLTDPLCCPLAAHAQDYGEILDCCTRLTVDPPTYDCTACCDGIDPKP